MHSCVLFTPPAKSLDGTTDEEAGERAAGGSQKQSEKVNLRVSLVAIAGFSLWGLAYDADRDPTPLMLRAGPTEELIHEGHRE